MAALPQITGSDDASNAMEFLRRLVGKKGKATDALSRQSYPQPSDATAPSPGSSGGAFVPFNSRPPVSPDPGRANPDQRLDGILSGVGSAIGKVRDNVASFRPFNSRGPGQDTTAAQPAPAADPAFAGDPALLEHMGNIAKAAAANRPVMPGAPFPSASAGQAPNAPPPSMIAGAMGGPGGGMSRGAMPSAAPQGPALQSDIADASQIMRDRGAAVAARMAPGQPGGPPAPTGAAGQALVDAVGSAPDPHREGKGDWRTALRAAAVNMIGTNGDFGDALGRGARAGSEEWERSKDKNKAEDTAAYDTRVKKAQAGYNVERDTTKEGQEGQKIGIEGRRADIEGHRVDTEADRNRLLDQERIANSAETARHNRAAEGIASQDSSRRDMIGRMMDLEKTARGTGPDADVAKSVLDRYRQPKIDPMQAEKFKALLKSPDYLVASPAAKARMERQAGYNGGPGAAGNGDPFGLLDE